MRIISDIGRVPKGRQRFSKIDLCPGGMNHYCLVTPDLHEMWSKQTYREITKPEKLVFVDSFSEDKGGVTRQPLESN